MSLNKALKGKIIRPIDSPTLGIYIKTSKAWPQNNSVMLSVRYFNLSRSEEGMSEDLDLLTINVNDFIMQYEIMNNADTAQSFSQATWETVGTFLDDWLDKQGE